MNRTLALVAPLVTGLVTVLTAPALAAPSGLPSPDQQEAAASEAHDAVSAEETDLGSTLTAGEQLLPGAYMESSSGQYGLYWDAGYLVEEHDGWFVWVLEQEVQDARLVMQEDGNAVVYSSTGPVFWTGTAGNPGAYMVLQDDGNLVVYSSAGRPLWQNAAFSDSIIATNGGGGFDPAQGTLLSGHYLTSSDRRWKLVMQSDGNLVLYAPTGAPRWWSGTAGNPGAELVAQTDGNVVVYDVSGRPLWQSGTRMTNDVVFLMVQTDGNVVLYELTGSGESVSPIWWTGTN